MKEFICINGHEFEDTLCIGEEENEVMVCPICKTDQFEKINNS